MKLLYLLKINYKLKFIKGENQNNKITYKSDIVKPQNLLWYWF